MSARKIKQGWIDQPSEREYEPIARLEYVDYDSNRGYGSGPDVVQTRLYRDDITGLAVADIPAFEAWLKTVIVR